MIKLNYLSGRASKIASAMMMLILFVVSSCKDDESAPAVATVQFATSAQTVSENGTPVTVNISFDKAAGKDGTITIAITEAANTDYATHYTTNPNGSTGEIEISVAEGQTSAQFTFTPVNNALLHDDRSVEFTISDVSSSFEIGTQDSNTITITDDEGPTQVNFASATGTIAENVAAGADVTLNLSSAAPGTGSVTVSFTSDDAEYTTNFTTEPAAAAGQITIPVAQGATSVSFKVKPVDDGDINENREITFALTAASGAVTAGTAIDENTFTIIDNETPSTVVFTDGESMIGEGEDEGTDISLTLDPQTNGTGTVIVTFTGGAYGDDFTTNPAAVSGEIIVPVASGVTAATFKVIPADNAVAAADKVITFTLSESTGIVTLGASEITHELTIDDDDAITTIAQVREDYPGSTTNITSSLRIQGIVTSINPQVNVNNIWVQDETGGIVVRVLDPNNNTIERGDEVNVQLQGGRYAEFSGLLQVEMVPNANVTVIDQDNTLPTPEVITVAELNSKVYEGKLVRINSVAFVDANGTATMSGTKVVSDGTNTTNVRTETGAPHASSVQPYGFGTITGLASENGGFAQIIPMVFADDVFASNPTGTIGVTASFTDFGSVNTGEGSASQSYTVQGTGLTQDVIITASTGFKVSLTDGGTYETTVTIPAASVNSATTVYVKFFPAAGGEQTGTLTHKSLGAEVVVTADLAGTGVGEDPLQALALWTFESLASSYSVTGASVTGFLAESGLQSGTASASGVHVSAATTYSSPAGNGTPRSLSSNNWAPGDYYEFSLNSTGFEDIKVSWDQMGSNTGPGSFVLQYSTDGTNFTQFGDPYVVINDSWSAGAPKPTSSYSVDLSSVTALNNSATLVFRIVVAPGSLAINGSAIATGGTGRVDNIKIEGR